MNTIELNDTLPLVFRHADTPPSEVWRRSVRLERGKTYLVEASSGAGKSSLCGYIMGYRRDYLGTISFDGRDIRHLGVGEWTALRSSHLSTLFQELRLFPELTAMENVEIKNTLTRFKSRGELRQMFERLGIADRMDTKVRLMSFGQQQRVAMLRALAQPFDFIIADEPVSHLDEANSTALGELMTEEARRQGAGVVVTSIGKHPPIDYDKTLRL